MSPGIAEVSVSTVVAGDREDVALIDADCLRHQLRNKAKKFMVNLDSMLNFLIALYDSSVMGPITQ